MRSADHFGPTTLNLFRKMAGKLQKFGVITYHRE